MIREATILPGVYIFTPRVFGDERGVFCETWSRAVSAEYGLPTRWAQDSQSISAANVIRGLHYQHRRPQGKLVRVSNGQALDVIVDVRRGSPAYGKHICVSLTAENYRMVFIPRGLAHGFLSLSHRMVFQYKCDAPYDPRDQCGIRWDDPDLAIDWPISVPPLLSAKDAALPFLKDIRESKLPRL